MHSLEGVRVLDFTRVLAGPFCTMLLGDLGADIIKIEAPRGDDTRHWGPPWAGDETAENRLSAYYLALNRNKRSIVLNLKLAEGREIARNLARNSHIVVENLKPGRMKAFGLAYDDLKQNNPALVYASITGFGQSGPYSDRPGYDHVIQAMSGLLSITGETEGTAYKVGVAVSDVISGLFALSGILAALRQAEGSGQGDYLDIALLDSQLAGLVNVASNALISGQDAPRYGNQHPNIVPYQNFSAADGDFALAVGNDGQFQALCHTIGQDEWADDPRFSTNPGRVVHRDILITLLQSIFETESVDYWVSRFVSVGIPAGPINSVLTALNDPHVAARGIVHEVALDDGTLAKLVGSPLGGTIHRPPPHLGQHSANILREAGYDGKTIARYQGEGVI